jgi:hypothetical protein
MRNTYNWMPRLLDLQRKLQDSINKGARQSWRLVGVVQDPTRPVGVYLVWDTTGFFSG